MVLSKNINYLKRIGEGEYEGEGEEWGTEVE